MFRLYYLEYEICSHLTKFLSIVWQFVDLLAVFGYLSSVCIFQGCGEASWLSEMLCSLAEILRLQDPASIHLEVVNLARKFPDFRYLSPPEEQRSRCCSAGPALCHCGVSLILMLLCAESKLLSHCPFISNHKRAAALYSVSKGHKSPTGSAD